MNIKEFADKLSSYNLFNYFFPGLIFVVILKETTNYNLYQKDLLIGAFLYYFIGLIISRIGSVLIENFLKHKKIDFVKELDIIKLLKAFKADHKIEIFFEVCNMYRTITAMFLLLILIKGYEIIIKNLIQHNSLLYIILEILGFMIFLFAYKKQNKYVFDCTNTEE